MEFLLMGIEVGLAFPVRTLRRAQMYSSDGWVWLASGGPVPQRGEEWMSWCVGSDRLPVCVPGFLSPRGRCRWPVGLGSSCLKTD